MSYSYDSASPTKYSTKSPLVTDLLIEHKLTLGRFPSIDGTANMNYFCLYVILVFLIFYPCLLKITLSIYHSIETYFFKDASSSNSILGNIVDLQDSLLETKLHASTLQDDGILNKKALVSIPKISSSSSSELSYFNLTNTAGHNLTAQEVLEVYYGPTGAPLAYFLSYMQNSQSGDVFSSSIHTSEDPSENVQSNVDDYDSTLDFGGLFAPFTESSEPSDQNNDLNKAAGSSPLPNKKKAIIRILAVLNYLTRAMIIRKPLIILNILIKIILPIKLLVVILTLLFFQTF